MKKNKYFLMSSLLISIIGFSCKKNSDSKTTTVVEYQVTPMNNGVFNLWYWDASNTDIMVREPSEDSLSPFAANGSKTIRILTRPFSAQLKIEFLSSSYVYDLAILVDGQVKKDTTVSRPYNGEFVEINYVVQ